jgi:hypothetical protein
MSWGNEQMKPGTTATGQATLATINDMPIHAVPKDAPMKEKTYDIHGKPYTLAQAQEGLKTGRFTLSHFGDDLLNALKAIGEAVGVGAMQGAATWNNSGVVQGVATRNNSGVVQGVSTWNKG